MVDISKTVQAKSDQLNADDLIAGPITINITKVTGSDDPDQPVSIHYEGDNGKPYKPCKSMRRVMLSIWGGNGEEYVGNSMTLYNDPEVKFGGIKVGGIRISHMTGLESTRSLMLTATRGKRKEYRVEPLRAAEPPEGLLDNAMAAANQGRDAFKKFWADNKAHRDFLKPHMPDLQKAVEAAEPKDELEDLQ